jgi:uncharacterized protein (DUF305 family)
MKLTLVLLTAAITFLASSCGNSSETTSTTADTSASANNSTAKQATTTQDTATSGNGLMKPMNDMMAKMQSMQMTGDFDVDFANMMVEHHQSALDMAQVEVSQGKDETLKTKAQEILTKQKKEQQELKDFVSSYKPSGMKHGEGELQKGMSKMTNKMKSMQMTGDVDKDFATMMASHHEDGISMAKMELKNGMSDKLKQMAQKSIDDQQKDIKEFESWLSSHK